MVHSFSSQPRYAAVALAGSILLLQRRSSADPRFRYLLIQLLRRPWPAGHPPGYVRNKWHSVFLEIESRTLHDRFWQPFLLMRGHQFLAPLIIFPGQPGFAVAVAFGVTLPGCL